ncbi:transport protein particle (TRAPP) component, putative [Bodo saltans]|uniref:Transport protein particle (TRAPP) component, putative n=1 Tax=Bodo saltans TaxID=75058 RepID=A0A0S4IZC2_BODSA|nr:transport protein particle (TRAPP) component, putative [Bodo saltans]|eukprot:CUG30492.1 transport protein particle (TRAPP) component, putative [Bodo saltans]
MAQQPRYAQTPTTGGAPAALAPSASSSAATTSTKIGDRAFDKIEKTSAEFFAITYGALVRQMFIDHNERADIVNTQLDQMGERIGVRLIEEYAARSGAPPCRSPAQAADSVAKIGLKMFNPQRPSQWLQPPRSSGPVSSSTGAAIGDAANGSNGGAVYSISFDENPLNVFVELPDALRQTLWYSNVLCGVIRGGLQQVGFVTLVWYVRDVLRGDDVNEIRIQFQGKERETFKVDMQK